MSVSLILIHGAWQTSAAWGIVAPRLREQGFDVHVIDLPGNGHDATPPEKVSLDLYAAHVGQVVSECKGPVVLVGHSGGATVASQVAENMPGRIAGLIFIAGIMLPSGVSLGELTEDSPSQRDDSGIWPRLVWDEGETVSRVLERDALEIFYHDAPEVSARKAAAALVPQPFFGLVLRPHLSAERFGSVPRVYVEALRDRSIPIETQRLMQKRVPGARVLQLDSGHAPLLSKPEEVVDIIEREAMSLVAAPA